MLYSIPKLESLVFRHTLAPELHGSRCEPVRDGKKSVNRLESIVWFVRSIPGTRLALSMRRAAVHEYAKADAARTG